MQYEDVGVPSAGSGNYLAYGVSSLPSSFPSASWLYITNDNLPNPWDTLPPYFASEVAALDPVATTITSTGTTASLTISTSPSNGFYIQTVQDNTIGTSTGGYYTPKSLSEAAGHSYSVTVDDYGGQYVVGANVDSFVRTNANGGGGIATFTLQGNVNLVFTLASSVSTTTTSSSSSTTSTVTTTTVTTTNSSSTSTTASDPAFSIGVIDQNGTPLASVWTVLYDQYNTMLWSGYGPVTLSLPSGLYIIQVNSYVNHGTRCIADHWSDGGPSAASKELLRAFSLDANLALIAVFNC